MNHITFSLKRSKPRAALVLLLLFFLGSSGQALANGGDILWQFRDSRANSQEPQATAMDSAGNMIVTGYTSVGGQADFFTAKIAADGLSVLWSATYDKAGSDDWGVAVAVDSNDDVIVSGFGFNGVNTDVITIKYNGTNGAELWASPHAYNGAANGNDYPKAIGIDHLDNIYVAGYSQNGGSVGDDGLLFKLTPNGPNPDGSPVWQQVVNGTDSGDDRFNNLAVDTNGLAVTGYSLVSHSGPRDDFDYLTIMFDLDGQEVWRDTYDHGTGNDLGYVVELDSSSNVVMSGEVIDGSRHDMQTIKYTAAGDDGNGTIVWQAVNSVGSPNVPSGLAIDENDEVYLTGHSFTVTGKDDFFTARYRSDNGTLVWDEIFDSGSDNTDVAKAIIVDDGSVFVTGYTHNAAGGDDDFRTIKYNKADGSQLWTDAFDGPAGSEELPQAVAVGLSAAPDGNLYVAGWSDIVTSSVSDYDAYVIKYDAGLLNPPTSLTATLISNTQVDLGWNDNSASPNEDNFCIERCQGYGCIDFAELTCAVAQNATTYSDTSVSANTWYSYQVKAYSATYLHSYPSETASILTTMINYPAPTWLYSHDGEGLDDRAQAIITTSDNQPVATGYGVAAGSQQNYFTVKMDRTNSSTPLWTATYDDPDGQSDVASSLATDDNDSIIVSGYSSLDSGGGGNSNDLYTIKYDKDGPDEFTGYPIWTAQYNGAANGDDRAIKVMMTQSTMAPLVAGHGKNASDDWDIYLVKYLTDYNAGGQQDWAITPYDSGYDDYVSTAVVDSNGDIIVVGEVHNVGGDSDIFIAKYAGSDGSLVAGWPHILDSGQGNDSANSVAVDGSDNIYVAGYLSTASSGTNWYVNKFDPSGNPQWGASGKSLDGGFNAYDEAMVIKVDGVDSEIVIAGTSTSASGSKDLQVVRYSPAGVLRWSKTLERATVDDFLVDMSLSISGDICLIGDTDNGSDSDILAVLYNFQGALLASTMYDSGYDDGASGVAANRLGEFYVAGYAATGPLAGDDDDFVAFRLEGQELQAPAPLTAQAHHTTVDLSWVENDASADGYKIYRQVGGCQEGGDTFQPDDLLYTATPAELDYTDTGLSINTTYCYGAQSYRNSNSAVSRIIEKEVTTTSPVAPDSLAVTVLNTSDIQVCWQDNTATEDGFSIQRCTGTDCDFSSVTTLNAPAEPDDNATQTCMVDTSACDSGSGKTFRYRVQAYKTSAWATGFTSPSGNMTTPALGDPSGLSATRVAEAQVDLQWTDNSGDETEFVIQRCTGSSCVDFAEVTTEAEVKDQLLFLQMDEASWSGAANEVLDSSGNDSHATAYNGPATSDDSHKGRSGDFDGSNDYVQAPVTVDQSATSAGATMMAWVKPDSTSSGYHFVISSEAGPSSKKNWGIMRNGSTWYVETGEASRSTGVAVDIGVWQHVAAVFIPGTGVKFYKNGVETLVSYIGTNSTSGNLTVGRQGAINSNYWDGLVDQAALYDRALDAVEVQELHDRGIFPGTTGLRWFTDTGLTYNTTYNYQILARKTTPCGDDTSAATNSIEVLTVPQGPVVSVGLVDNGRANLTWTPTTSTQTGFQVERCAGSGCSSFTVLDSSLASDVVSYLDETLCYGSDGINRYQVRALGGWGASDPSSVVQVQVVPDAAPTSLTADRVTEAQVELSWTAEDSMRDGFTILRCDGNGCTPSTEISGSPTGWGDPALDALWQFNEMEWDGTANQIVDSSGNGNNATAVNGPQIVPPGKFGYGHGLFDGIDDHLTTSLTVDQSASTVGATFEAWVYPTTNTNSYKCVLSTSNSTNDYDWGFCQYGSNWYVDNGASRSYVTSALLNQWQHLVAVFEPGVGVRFYKNGASSTVATLGAETNAALTIGREGAASGSYFPGMIDQVAIYNRPLTDTEVQERYNTGNTPARTFSFVDTDSIGLATEYSYKVGAMESTTCNDLAANANFALLTEVTTPAVPAPPTDLTCTTIDTTQVSCTWTLNTSAETKVVLERCEGAGCSSATQSFNLAAGAASYTDTSACEGTIYEYWVRAEKETATTWATTDSASSQVTTDTAQTPVISSLTALSESQVSLTWTDSNDDEDSYTVSRCLYDSPTVLCDQPGDFSQVDSQAGSVDGAVLHYRMDEALWNGTSNEVVDASGNGKHGRSYSGATTGSEGKYDRAGAFDGSDDYVSSSLSVNQALGSPGATFEAWARPTLSDTTYRFVISTDNGGNDWSLAHYNGTWYVATGENLRSTGLSVDLDTWQHVAASFIPGTGVKFYKNGVEAVVSYIDYDSSTASTQVGRRGSYSSGYRFQGLIDEVQVYPFPLSQTQVQGHYDSQAGIYGFADSGLTNSSTYFYKVTAAKTGNGCGWSTEVDDNVTTPAPPPPTNLSIVCDSTICTLEFDDNNGSESGYKISRCEGASSACGSPTQFTLTSDTPSDTGTLNYIDDTACPGQEYTYEVWAEGGWGTTTSVETTLSTDNIATAPANLGVILASEVEIQSSWDYTQADETGIKLERCIDASCVEIDLAAGSTGYSDNELAPDTDYCYRVAAYKDAICNSGWQTAWTAQSCQTTTFAQAALSATVVDTTNVELAWSDNFTTETSTVIERCEGSIASCCGGDPSDCNGTFATVGSALAENEAFTDSSACANTGYTYRVNTKGEGLSKDGSGCWTMRAPLTFTSFAADSGVVLEITYQSEMQADFSDIRFFDATGNRELRYWIKEKTDSTTATVWLMTGANNDIYLYYGNDQATDASGDDTLFTEIYDDFAGTVIDTDKWVEIDPNNEASQNDGLIFTTVSSTQDTALISTATFDRAPGNELFIDFSVGDDTTTRTEYFSFGWEKDQTSSAHANQLMHGIYMDSYSNHRIRYIYENGSLRSTPSYNYYNDRTDYQAKIVLKDAGAIYSLKGGLYTDWTQLHEYSTAWSGDDTLRISFHQSNHKMTINWVQVKHASAVAGAAVDFGSAQGDGVACLALANTWNGTPTLAAAVTTDNDDAPSGLSADATLATGTVHLAWTSNTTDESDFLIERDCGGGFSQIGTSAAGVYEYDDSGYTPSTNCTYQVKAYKDATCTWTSEASNQVVLAAPPAAPTLTATALSSNSIRLDWSNTVGEDGFLLETQVFNGNWMPITTLGPDVLTYTHSMGLNPETSYSYRIYSYRGGVYSAPGNDSATTATYTEGDGDCP